MQCHALSNQAHHGWYCMRLQQLKASGAQPAAGTRGCARTRQLGISSGANMLTSLLPLCAQATPRLTLDADKAAALTARIQDAGTEVVNAKAGSGSATLSMAYAAAKFADACLRAMGGEGGIVECAYVASRVTELPFFASRVRIGRSGAEEVMPPGPMSAAEAAGMAALKAELAASIQKGIEFANK